MKSVNWPKPGYSSITCSTISNISYNLIFTTKFNDSSILITIISCDYLNLSLADEHVGDVTIPTQVIEYNQNFLQANRPIRLQYSNQIKLLGKWNLTEMQSIQLLTSIQFSLIVLFLQKTIRFPHFIEELNIPRTFLKWNMP